MPELPEVETTRRGIEPHLVGRRVRAVAVHQPQLRYPVPAALARELPGQTIRRVGRRAKYLLLEGERGTLILHLGMSGSLRLVPASDPLRPHDHLCLTMEGGLQLRLHDPRRFGAALWTRDDHLAHPLLRGLGPEPLGDDFTGIHLHRAAQGRRIAVKALLMESRIVVGVGNIYASEALFRAGIDPRRAAGRIALARYERLADCVRETLTEALEAGGTTLRDYLRSDGEPGYFALRLDVYGRTGEACRRCDTPIRQVRLAQRSTFYCPGCQR